MLPKTSPIRMLALLASSALFVACSDSSAPIPVTQSPNTLTASSSTSLAAVVNHEVDELPSAIVRDANGKPVPGVRVMFNIERGGGIATATIDTTDAAGVARVGGWKLGIIAGLNVLSAQVSGQPKILFSAQGLADAPSRITKFAGDNQRAPAGAETYIRPQVKISDSFNNPVRGLKVVFAVTGGGEISNPDVVTDSSGLATPGSWVLGQGGTQTLVATAEGLEPQTFSATVLVDSYSCAPATLLTGENYTGALTSRSCATADGTYYDKFTVVLTNDAHVITVRSSNFSSNVEIRRSGMIASSSRDSSKSEHSIKTILPAGVYTLVVSSTRPNMTGPYLLFVVAAPAQTSQCEETFIGAETVTEQSTNSYDCNVDGTYSADRFKIYLNAGEPLVVETLDRSYSNHYLSLTNARGETVATPVPATSPYVSTISFAAPAAGFYTLHVASETDDSAEYRLTVR
ncbi:MAG: Ig-like domain-containing protein [Gemmatimonadaceae bacterium]|nr:Ig-like domain-containing protein [Gemmatimonadaceae bacterium]MBA3657525.1 Ig-like domain-containing protein [Gemmatimonadaceae bacterium]